MCDSAPNEIWYKNYVGLDLSYSSTGAVIIDESGGVAHFAFKAGTPKDSFTQRIEKLWQQLARVLPKPDTACVVLEGAAYAAEFKAFELGELTGAIKVKLADAGYSFDVVAPSSLKKFVTGKGNANKSFVAVHVAKKWGFVHPCNDIVDAYALAQYARHSKGTNPNAGEAETQSTKT